MSEDNIVGFPKPEPSQKPELPPEERARRLRMEVERLVALPTVERKFYIECTDIAEKHGVSQAIMESMVETAAKEREKKRVEDRAEDREEKRRLERRQEREDKRFRQEKADARKEAERARKEAERIEREQEVRQKKRDTAFAQIAALPRLAHAVRLKEAAKRLGEDFEILLEEFELYYAALTIPESLEPWPHPVDLAELLGQIETKISRYLVVSKAIAATATLWTVFTWVVELAVHAPKLVFHFPEKDAGKSTALGVLHRMVLRPYLAIEATGAVIFRIVDRLRPTLLLDEADRLFQRSTILAHIINASWTNGGQRVPRVAPGGQVVEYDVYGAQAISMKGLDMPDTTLSRCILCMIWPKLPSEVVEEFTYADDDEFRVIRRKLARWSVDNAVALREAQPESAPGFNNRIRMNWRALFAIADLAGGAWRKRARAAAIELEMDRDEPSEAVRLFAAVQPLVSGREWILSADICKVLNADPTGVWSNFRGKGPISQTQVAALFRPFGIRPTVLHPTRRADESPRGYRASQFQNVFARLLQKPTRDPHTRTSRGRK